MSSRGWKSWMLWSGSTISRSDDLKRDVRDQVDEFGRIFPSFRICEEENERHGLKQSKIIRDIEDGSVKVVVIESQEG